MGAWSEALRNRLMAYCRIDVLEEGDEALLEGLYLSAVSYLDQAGIAEPEEGTPRRAQYDLCVNHLVLDGYDRRGAAVGGSAPADNPVFRRMLVQLGAPEPVPDWDT